MNRHERRRVKSVGIDRAVAIHEAGHAVGRLLTAHDLGLQIEEAVDHITVSTVPSFSAGRTGSALAQATTYGPMFSKELDDVIRSAHAGSSPSVRDLSITIANSRSKGTDTKRWVAVKTLITVFASAAEARLLKRQFTSVWNSDECQADQDDFVRDCTLAGLDLREMAALLDAASTEAVNLIETDEVWHAVEAIAEALSKRRTIRGPDFAKIVGGSFRQISGVADRILLGWESILSEPDPVD